MILWSIDAEKHHVTVGEIQKCEILTEEQALGAYKYFKNNGLLELMRKDIQDVGGNVNGLEWEGLFNIRFTRQDCILYDPLPVSAKNEKIANLTRYNLVAIDKVEGSKYSNHPVSHGSYTIPTSHKYVRTGSGSSIIDPYHPILQGALMKLLQDQYGTENVKREESWVDIKVKCRTKTILVEIKTEPTAKRAIREAIGQVLEYAYFPKSQQNSYQTDTELIIIAPGEADEKIDEYLGTLRNKFGIPIRYSSFAPGETLPEIFRR